jgi:hypothetical protein
VITELQEQLLAREKELDSQEGTVVVWKESLMALARALREASAERDASHACADVIQWDYSAQVNAFSSWSGRLNDLSQTLEERATLLGMQEVISAVELECCLLPPVGQDLSAELDKAPTSVNRTADDRAAKAEWLSLQVVQVAGVLVDLGLLPVEDIPQLPKTAQ